MFSGRDPAVQQQTRDDVVVVFFSAIYYIRLLECVCCTFPVLFP